MKKVVVFVHGLGGGLKTWGDFQTLLANDEVLDFDTDFFCYTTSIARCIPFLQRKYGGIETLANSLRTHIEKNLSHYDEIVIVAHSLGGLIVRQLLLNLQSGGQEITSIRKAMFFAVPNNGSKWAELSNLVSWDHAHLRQLCKDSTYLKTLNAFWLNQDIEGKLQLALVLGTEDHIVTHESAVVGFQNSEINTISGDHKGICKPRDIKSASYVALRSFLLADISISKFRKRGLIKFEDIRRDKCTNNFYADACREKVINRISTGLSRSDPYLARVVAPSGIGKTRVVLEALKTLDQQTLEDTLYFDCALQEHTIIEHLTEWKEKRAKGTLIADNCSFDLHNKLHNLMANTDCAISLITLDYDHQKAGSCDHIELERLDDAQIKCMLEESFGADLRDINRIVAFAQGFPLMATLLANDLLAGEPNIGLLSDDNIAKKLLGGTGIENTVDENILMSSALFDRFGLEESVADQAAFIAEHIAHVTPTQLYDCIKRFHEVGIIDLRGRYAQVVPKPLAIRLASQWWKRRPKQEQEDLINRVPADLVSSFCDQIGKLDSLPEVKALSASLCGVQGLFGDAEVIFSERGSQLFRALVEVSPDETARAMSSAIHNATQEHLLEVKDTTRWYIQNALEMLVFHSQHFESAAWSILLLAKAETESFSNNSSGLFVQLFRTQLSGTQKPLIERYVVLERALQENSETIDTLIIEALKEGLNDRATKTMGAEAQGTRPSLIEWRPKTWQEIFDHWDYCINKLVSMLSRGNQQNEQAIAEIGHSLRFLILRGRLSIVDFALAKVVEANGQYWPEALDALKTCRSHDTDGMPPEGIEKLNQWIELLNPNPEEILLCLKIIVKNPPYETREDDNGGYIDVAAENAGELAGNYSYRIDDLIPHLSILLTGNQKQTFHFGKTLALQSNRFEEIFDEVVKICPFFANFNPALVYGLLEGCFERNTEIWERLVDALFKNPSFHNFYPSIITTGKFNRSHLDNLLSLASRSLVTPSDINFLGFGKATDHCEAADISIFCSELAKMNDKLAWSAINIMYMYCLHNEERYTFSGPVLVSIIQNLDLASKNRNMSRDMHMWSELVKRYYRNNLDLCESIFCNYFKLNHETTNFSDLWHYLKPTVVMMTEELGDKLWPIFERNINTLPMRERYKISFLFDAEESSYRHNKSIFSAFETSLVIKWCNANIDWAPKLVANSIEIFDAKEEDKSKNVSNTVLSLLSNFGSDDEIPSILLSKLWSRGWSGSPLPMYEADLAALSHLKYHESTTVRKWAGNAIDNVKKYIESEEQRQEEHSIGVW